MLKFINIKLIIFGVFALLAFGAFLVLPKLTPAHAAGTTYYVRADGTVLAANKANATSPTAAATSLNMAQVKLASFSAGDQILFSSQGGGYTEVLNLPSGGTGVGNEITYANVPTETPTIAIATNPLINTNSKSNVKVVGFNVNYTGVSDWAWGIKIDGNASTNVTVQGNNITMGTRGFGIVSSANSLNNIVMTGNAITGALKNSLYFYGTGLSNISITDQTVVESSPGPNFANITGLTIDGYTANAGVITISNSSDVTITDIPSVGGITFTTVTTGNIDSVVQSAGSGLSFTDSSDITVNDSSVTGTTAYGAFQAKGTSHDITYNRCTANNNTKNGFVQEDTANDIICNNCTADYNGHIGFLARESASNIIYNYSEASYNGTVNVTTDGGGFLPHDSATNVRVYNSIAHHNYNQGYGDVSSGDNSFINSVNWANAYALGDTFRGNPVVTPSIRGNMYLSKTGGTLTVRNVISSGSNLREIRMGNPDFIDIDYNVYFPADNNKFINYDGITDTSWTTYHVTEGNESHSQNADPDFVTPGTDFHLQSTSPAIDAGVDMNVNTDYAGKQRYDVPGVANTGSAGAYTKNYVDIGAYEYVTPPNPTLSSIACPNQATYCYDPTPDITVGNTSPTTSYNYLVNQTLAPLKADVEAGTADADGSFTVPDGVIPNALHATYYIHVIAQNLDGDFSDNYSSYKIIHRDRSSGVPEEPETNPETEAIPTVEDFIQDVVTTAKNLTQTDDSPTAPKPVTPTITDITSQGEDLLISGTADPNATVYLIIHSDPFNAQTVADNKGVWQYLLKNASDVLGEGDHTIFAIATVKTADGKELTSKQSKTYDFKLSVDDGQLKVEMKKTKVWQWVAGGAMLLFLVLIFSFLLLRKRTQQ